MTNNNEKNTLTQNYVKGLITDYDFVRSHIITTLISKERKENEERLTGPHTTVCGDIVMGYRILLEKSSIYITGQLDQVSGVEAKRTCFTDRRKLILH